jgi:Skp family chaperone for outer membrane proteins
MKLLSKWLLVPAVTLGLAVSAAAAAAEEAGTVRLATANPSKILSQMQETKDRNTALESERQNLATQEQAKVKEIQDLKKQLEFIKKGTSEYKKATGDILQKSVELETWGKLKQADLTRRHKEGIKELVDKIDAAIAVIAAEKKIDLVIADFGVDFPEDLDTLTPEQLHALIRQKNVLFAAKGVDISADVVTRLDAAYKK